MIMRLSYKAIWGTAVFLNFEFKILCDEKYPETIRWETITEILFEICLMEYQVEPNGILMRISNTLLSLWACRILTKNVEVGIYSNVMST